MRIYRYYLVIVCCIIIVTISLSGHAEGAIQMILPSGATIDANIKGAVPESLPVYEMKSRQISSELLLDLFEKEQKPLSIWDSENSYRWESDSPWRMNEFGEPEYDVIVCFSYNNGRVMYRETEFSNKQGLILDCAENIYNSWGKTFSGECAYKPLHEEVIDVVTDLREICNIFEYKLKLSKALSLEDIENWQQYLTDNPQLLDNMTAYGYRWMEKPSIRDEAYWLVFGMYLNDIPILMNYDTPNYLEGNWVGNFSRFVCRICISADGYRDAVIECIPTIEKATAPQPIMDVHQALEIFNDYVFNDGDYLYPQTIRQIYLEYIWICNDDSSPQRGTMRPFWCFNEEPQPEFDYNKPRQNYAAYRIDAITGKVLECFSEPGPWQENPT